MKLVKEYVHNALQLDNLNQSDTIYCQGKELLRWLQLDNLNQSDTIPTDSPIISTPLQLDNLNQSDTIYSKKYGLSLGCNLTI